MQKPDTPDLTLPIQAPGRSPGDDGQERLSRRRFLRSGIATAATLSAGEWVSSRPAAAQLVDPKQRLFWLDRPYSRRLPGNEPLRTCHLSYRYDFPASSGGSTSLPANLFLITRQGQPLSPVVVAAPFKDPAAPGGDPFPAAAPLSQPWVAVCHRLVAPIRPATLRVFEWCTLYCVPEDEIVITVGRETLTHRVPITDIIFDLRVDLTQPSPLLVDFWGGIQPTSPNAAIGGLYYYTYCSQQGAISIATWNGTFEVNNGHRVQISAFIPGSSQPQSRTSQARYTILHAGIDSPTVATLNQQFATAQWAPLIGPEGPFFRLRAGTFQVQLTDETGETNGSRIVVANAIRWQTA